LEFWWENGSELLTALPRVHWTVLTTGVGLVAMTTTGIETEPRKLWDNHLEKTKENSTGTAMEFPRGNGSASAKGSRMASTTETGWVLVSVKAKGQ
jgi:hypothetical protein